MKMFKRKKKYSDESLVNLIKQGNSDEALSFLYKNVQPKISNWIKSNNGSSEEAQDIFQESVISFYSYVIDNKFKDGQSVQGFIFSIARNKWVNRVKYKNKFVDELPDIQEEFDLVGSSDFKNIENILSKLGQKCKELLTYSIFYKMSMKDIAIRMNYSSENAVKSKNYKCKQRLVTLVKSKQSLKEVLYNE